MDKRLINFISIKHGEECLIKIRGKYYKALARECSICGLDFKILEDVPFELNAVDDGWESSNIIIGYYYGKNIEEDPTLVIPYGENEIEFWRKKNA